MFTYDEIAKQLGIPRGTLSRKLLEHNRRAVEPIKPDKIDDRGHYRIHLYTAETVDKIAQAFKNFTGKRGRPGEATHQPAQETA
jgi:hypothetical protein